MSTQLNHSKIKSIYKYIHILFVIKNTAKSSRQFENVTNRSAELQHIDKYVSCLFKYCKNLAGLNQRVK